jgi:hypothetical protein
LLLGEADRAKRFACSKLVCGAYARRSNAREDCGASLNDLVGAEQ